MRALKLLLLFGIIFNHIQYVKATTEDHIYNADDYSNHGGFMPEPMCGARCMWQIAHMLNRECSLTEIVGMCHVDSFKGSSMQNLVDCAKNLRLNAIPVKTNLAQLIKQPCIAILLLDLKSPKYEQFGHFVIFDSIEKDMIKFVDGAAIKKMALKDFKSIWEGFAVFVTANNDDFETTLSLCSHSRIISKRAILMAFVTIVLGLLVYFIISKFFYCN